MDTASPSGSRNVGPARLSVRLFGGFVLRAFPGGESAVLLGKRERIMLAYLILSPNSRRSRQKLAGLLWGGVSEETALHNLRSCVWNLRKALDDGEHRLIASE